MTDQQYEKLVDALEKKCQRQIDSAARHAYTKAGGGDHGAQEAYDAVFTMLVEDPDWEPVEAVDISDIAYEAAGRADR